MDDTSLKEDVLQLLKFKRYRRRWNKSPLRDLFCRAVMLAATEGDETFFKRLGRSLERKPMFFRKPAPSTQIERALVNDWISDHGFCLCWCSDQAIADLLGATKAYYCDFEAVRKARQRLRLRKPSLRPVTSVSRGNNGILLA